MTRIKICGLTTAEDARAAAALGADALGFIGVPDTPRHVTPDQVREATVGLPPFVIRVVVVYEPLNAVKYPVDAIQYYAGDKQTARGLRRIRVVRVRDANSLEKLPELSTYRQVPDAILLDTYHEKTLGGGGTTFDWRLALEAKRLAGDIPIVLAGGLTPENVGEAVRAIRPYAVDVASGVEAEPRRKDHDKMRRFIDAVRAADRDSAV